jgi:hypothetical protein
LGIGGKLTLDGLPGLGVDDGGVLARVACTLVGDLADMERVGEELADVAATEGLLSAAQAAWRGCQQTLLRALWLPCIYYNN